MMALKHSQILWTLSFLIAVCLTTLPAQAKYSGGTGEPNDPYQIATAGDLIALGETPEDYGKHFILTADIDLDPNLPGRRVFDRAVIAPDIDPNDQYSQFQGMPFTGVFDGNGHTISHLTIRGAGYIGLFGQLGKWKVVARVKDLGVVDVAIIGSGSHVGGLTGGMWFGDVTNCYSVGGVGGKSSVGGLAGVNDNGTVTHCYSTVGVSGSLGVGGLVGFNGGVVSKCYSSGTVVGNDEVGGLVGGNEGTVAQCYSTGAVSGNDSVGGLVGYNEGTVAQCYSTGEVSGTGEYSGVGGLVGCNDDGRVTNCYSTGAVSGTGYYVGGLVGDNLGEITRSVWDVETSGVSESSGGVGLTTAAMIDPEMLGLNGFASDPNWLLDGGRDYPRLAWEGASGQIIPEPNIDWLEGSGTDEEPYRVGTAEQLIFLGRASALFDRHFVLTADIDLDPNLLGGKVFDNCVIAPASHKGTYPYVQGTPFAGVFDGNGHAISHLTIIGHGYLGLFGRLGPGAEVKNLSVLGVKITGSGMYVGGLAGVNCGHVSRCYSTGTIAGGFGVGGLVGSNGRLAPFVHEAGTVTQCYSTGVVSGESRVGGLVGVNIGTIEESCASGTVAGPYSVGGLVGANADEVGGPFGGAGGTVSDCYSTCSVTGKSLVGGLVGNNYSATVSACYSAGAVSGESDVGGLVGNNTLCIPNQGCQTGAVTQCFWDTETSGQTESAGGVGKATAEMQDPNTFMAVGWDLVGQPDGPDDIWAEPQGGGYPILWWQLPPGFGLPTFSGGTGEPNDPYHISTPGELNSIGCNPRLMEAHFELVNDIDLGGIDFHIIGSELCPFAGSFNGNGHKVSRVTIKGRGYLGLFGQLGRWDAPACEVRNLGVVDVNVTGSDDCVGGLAGSNWGS